jgi:hypothetical protein
MTRLNRLRSMVSDTGKLKRDGDIPYLIRLLGSTDPTVQWHAAEALGDCGEKAVPLLVLALKSHSVPVRLGAIEALGTIRDFRAGAPIITVLNSDTSLEVRWAAVLALGEIGLPDALPILISLLRDPDRYLRYGAATALDRLGWQPEHETDKAFLLIARQDWESVRQLGASATQPLLEILRDTDPATREAIASVLGRIKDRHAQAACQVALKDRDPQVRWKAVLASIRCGLSSEDLPIMVAGRKRTGPNPAAAALLNFLFPGIGYNYLGKWWGFPLFMTYMSLLVLAQLAMGPFLPYIIVFPVTALIGIQTYYMAERMPDL